MASMYDKPVRLLMQDMIESMGLQAGQVFSCQDVIQWFSRYYPKVKQGTVVAHLMRLSTNVESRLQRSAKADGSDDHFYKIDSSNYRLYEKGIDPTPISDLTQLVDEEPIARNEAEGQFAYEHDLRDYLARNLQLVEDGLQLYSDDDVKGIEFPVGGRYIDLLAIDSSGDYVVIELKVSKGYDRVIGQLLRYVNWIKKHQANPGQKVRGSIIAKNISDDLKLACSGLPDITLYEYELAVTVNKAG